MMAPTHISTPPIRLLVIRMSALGDVAMTLPVIYALARQYPHIQITVLTQPFFSKLFINRPPNIALVQVDTKGIHRGVNGLWQLIRFLKQQKFTHVADLHNVLRSHLITLALKLNGAKTAMVDKNRRGRKALTRKHNKNLTAQSSYIQRYVDVFARLGWQVDLTFESLFANDNRSLATAEAPLSAQSLLQSLPSDVAFPDNKVANVGIAPFARYHTKTYPVDKMEQVVAQLHAANTRIYLFGGKGREATILQSWAEKYDNCIALPGKLNLSQELALMSRLNVMLSMDSANMHLASLVDTPVVSVWGGTTPECGFMGYRQSADNALCLHLSCQPCSIAGTPQCPLKTDACMQQLSPDVLVNAIKRLISHAPSA